MIKHRESKRKREKERVKERERERGGILARETGRDREERNKLPHKQVIIGSCVIDSLWRDTERVALTTQTG